MKRAFNATHIYLYIEIAASILFPMIFVASSLYQVTTAGLTPLQLVLGLGIPGDDACLGAFLHRT